MACRQSTPVDFGAIRRLAHEPRGGSHQNQGKEKGPSFPRRSKRVHICKFLEWSRGSRFLRIILDLSGVRSAALLGETSSKNSEQNRRQRNIRIRSPMSRLTASTTLPVLG